MFTLLFQSYRTLSDIKQSFVDMFTLLFQSYGTLSDVKQSFVDMFTLLFQSYGTLSDVKQSFVDMFHAFLSLTDFNLTRLLGEPEVKILYLLMCFTCVYSRVMGLVNHSHMVQLSFSGLLCLMPLSTIFQLYRGGQFC